MTTQTTPEQSTQQEWQYETAMTGGLVVGFDGSPASQAALESAAVIAASRRWPVHVVSVLAPMSSYRLELGRDRTPSEIEDLRRQLRDAAVRDAIGTAAERSSWTHQVVVGNAAPQIAKIAEKRGADLIILGRSQRGMIDRLVTGETTLQVMRCSSVPVLVVDSEMAAPATAVVAADFGPASVRAARAAIGLLGKGGTLYLVYVEQPVDLFPGATIAPAAEHYPGEVFVLFRRMIEGLRVPSGVIVETVVLNGAPVPTLEEFCERVGADLLAAGTHALSRAASFFLGSVSTGLVRRTPIPLLIAPTSG
jgi:nucleotide-binding universal stress UspA family protein